MEISNQYLKLNMTVEAGHVQLLSLSPANGPPWLPPKPGSELFACQVDSQRLSPANLSLVRAREEKDGIHRLILTFQGETVQVEYSLLHYDSSAILEGWPVIRNISQQPVNVQRIDSLSLQLSFEQAELLSFTGDWGSEFEPRQIVLNQKTVLESRTGRSSKGNHPWFALIRQDGQVLSGSVAWSANWIFRFEPVQDSVIHLSGGVSDWEFGRILAPGETIQGAPVLLTLGQDLDQVSQQLARIGRKYWYPANKLSSSLPVEWNHWWSYEDVEINEAVFLQNVDKAAEMGFEVCTLDAGWFGPSDPGTFWEHYRGDWHLVNEQRFPSGLRKLADRVHERGMKFGLWCEIEGLGSRAALAREHPEYVALRDGTPIGQVCFGNRDACEWAYQTLARLITDYQCDWIKVDFNLDPGAGCNRTDHGHGHGDGLYAHVHGYYQVMERLRREFPVVIFENCSSGGLRIDLGTLRQTHMTYLSDRDYPVHDLQIFWGASQMLAPNVLLHWTFSHWRHTDPPPYQTFNPHDPSLTRAKWDYMARISMLGVFGLSQKLPELPEWLYDRMVENIQIYKSHVRRFVKEADLYHLTGQPRRNGEGDRWAAFQYSLPDGSEHLLFTFRLQNSESERIIHLKGLAPERVYRVQGLEGEADSEMSGQDLMEKGLLFTDLREEESSLLRIY
jgi:alpha-galactosidase